MRQAEAVTFAGGTIDRATHLRGDVGAQAALWADPAARCLALVEGRLLLDLEGAPRLAWLPTGSPVFAGSDSGQGGRIFLGFEAGAPRFAATLPNWLVEADPAAPRPFLDTSSDAHPDLPETLRFADLRARMAELGPAEAAAAATAKGIFGWHASHRFCSNCGAPSEMVEAGWKRRCPTCGTEHFPRTDPVVIMLITHGNALLLGRSPAWPPGMYSLLAGFMEPGETIEAAVRRETFEEAGIAVGQVDYLSSQPWPFPGSLMLGCHGEALSREIRRDPNELEDARWVSREGVLAAIAGHDPDLRPARHGSIARFLIDRWLADKLD